MKSAICVLESLSPISFSKHIGAEKLDKELPRDYEARCWRERLHIGAGGNVIIPPMMLKNCIAAAAKYLGIQVPGKGKQNYTKHFEAGVMVTEPIVLPVKADDVQGEWLFVPSDGVRGSGKRVEKCFPFIPQWTGTAEFHVLDETITEDAFALHLREAGKFIGLGRFRPRNNGYYGRFDVKSVEWS